jgi:DNA (cytosine-5)-methyltransferase 1
LSDILETGDVPQRFFLSATACKGILRRAERRGKKLPEVLRVALTAQAGMATGATGSGLFVLESRTAMKTSSVSGGGNSKPIEVATCNTAKSTRLDFESETFVVDARGYGEGADASEDGTGRGTPIIAFPERMSGTQCAVSENVSPALMAKNPTAIATRWIVRRLTPRECERLQGFPDDYTLVPHRGKPAKDGPRYKGIGNSWETHCAQWIGRRIEEVDEIMERAGR